jgi:hypothetical protein
MRGELHEPNFELIYRMFFMSFSNFTTFVLEGKFNMLSCVGNKATSTEFKSAQHKNIKLRISKEVGGNVCYKNSKIQYMNSAGV